MVDQGRTTAVERMEIGGFLGQCALLPTPEENAAPLERQRAHSGLVGFARLALRLRIDPRPAGMPDRCGGPLYKRVPQELWTLKPPVPPGLLPAAFGPRRAPRLCLPCGSGGRAFPLFATGDEQPGGTDGACPWERRAQGAIGMAVSALREGMIKGLARRQGDPEVVDKGLDEHGMRGDTPRIGGQGGGGFDGVEALCNNAVVPTSPLDSLFCIRSTE